MARHLTFVREPRKIPMVLSEEEIVRLLEAAPGPKYKAALSAAYLAPLRRRKWHVYCKAPFAGPEAVLAYLSRYTHRVAISNRRLLSAGENGVTFKYKDYRIEGPGRYKTMTLATGEFIRRFLIHVLPKGFHRIRHYGLLASANRVATIARARELLAAPSRPKQPETSEAAAADEPRVMPRPCPCCGGRMIIIESFARGCRPTHRPTPTSQEIRIELTLTIAVDPTELGVRIAIIAVQRYP